MDGVGNLQGVDPVADAEKAVLYDAAATTPSVISAWVCMGLM